MATSNIREIGVHIKHLANVECLLRLTQQLRKRANPDRLKGIDRLKVQTFAYVYRGVHDMLPRFYVTGMNLQSHMWDDLWNVLTHECNAIIDDRGEDVLKWMADLMDS